MKKIVFIMMLSWISLPHIAQAAICNPTPQIPKFCQNILFPSDCAPADGICGCSAPNGGSWVCKYKCPEGYILTGSCPSTYNQWLQQTRVVNP